MPAAPPPQEREFDITNYSITITLGVVFAFSKLLSYLGVIDGSN